MCTSRFSRAGLFIFGLVMAFPGAEAQAQSREIRNVIVEQNRVIERFRPPLEMQRRVDLSVPLDRRALVELPEEAFPLHRVEVTGASFLSAQDLSPLWEPLLGRAVGRAEIEELVLSIERFYREQDVYARALVTDWNGVSGLLSLEVFEGYLEEITVESEIPGIAERLRPYLDRIAGQVPLRVSQLERELLLMADLEGIDIEADLQQVPERVGAGRLTLDVPRTGLHAQAQLDNFVASDTGPWQFSAVGSAGDIFGLFEQTTLVGVVNPITPRRFRLGQLNQAFPVGTDGLKLGYTLDYVRAAPGGEARRQDLQIDSTLGSLWAEYPFLRRIEQNVIGRLELAGQNDEVRAGSLKVVEDDQRWLSASLSYDRLLERGAFLSRIGFSQGLAALDATDADDPRAGRQGGRPDFRLISAELHTSYGLAEGWGLQAGAIGQMALNRPPAAARLSIGDENIGRAFTAASLSSDSGFAASLTLRHDLGGEVPELEGFGLFVFGDYAYLHNDPKGTDFRSAHLSAMGVGVTYKNYLQLGLSTPVHSSRKIEDFDTRVFVKLAYGF